MCQISDLDSRRGLLVWELLSGSGQWSATGFQKLLIASFIVRSQRVTGAGLSA